MREEIEPWDELEALRRKSQQPCENCPTRKIKVMNDGDLKAPEIGRNLKKSWSSWLIRMTRNFSVSYACALGQGRTRNPLLSFNWRGQRFNDPQATADTSVQPVAPSRSSGRHYRCKFCSFLGQEDGYLFRALNCGAK